MVQTKTNQIEKLEQLHQLVNNEVNGPKFYEFLEKNVPTHYDTGFGEQYSGWNPWINMCEYLHKEVGNNVLNLNSENEKDFFLYCIFNDDYDAFLNECNGNYYGDSDVVLSSESDWERYTQNILNVINK
jgi:hypothetical protein